MDKWDSRFIDIAKQVSSWSSCYKVGVGCVITKDNRIISTGYNGAPCGIETCRDRGYCYKSKFGVTAGTSKCFATHAEQNAIVQAARLGVSIDGATLYCTHKPCSVCSKLIINSGIKRIVYLNEYDENFSDEILNASNVVIEKFTV